MKPVKLAFAITACSFLSAAARADVRITEIMFEGKGLDTVEFKKDGTPNYKVIDDKREFFEITNLGNSSVNINGWVYDDDKAGDSLAFGSQFGSLAAGESLILTEMTADGFRALWNLGQNVKICSIGGLSNLGKNDTINIYDANNAIVDSVTYPVGFGASGVSYNRPENLSGDTSDWVMSSVGDAFNTHHSNDVPLATYSTLESGVLVSHVEGVARFDIANPGYYPTTSAVPVPAAAWLMGSGLLGLAGIVRRRK